MTGSWVARTNGQFLGRGPVVVGLGVGQHQSADAFAVPGGDQLGDRAALVVSNHRDTVEAELVEQREDGADLGWQGPVSAGRRLGVAEPEQIRCDAPELSLRAWR